MENKTWERNALMKIFMWFIAVQPSNQEVKFILQEIESCDEFTVKDLDRFRTDASTYLRVESKLRGVRSVVTECKDLLDYVITYQNNHAD